MKDFWRFLWEFDMAMGFGGIFKDSRRIFERISSIFEGFLSFFGDIWRILWWFEKAVEFGGIFKDFSRIFEVFWWFRKEFWWFLKLRKNFFTNDELNDTLRRVAGTGSRALKQTAGSRWSSSTESDCGWRKWLTWATAATRGTPARWPHRRTAARPA